MIAFHLRAFDCGSGPSKPSFLNLSTKGKQKANVLPVPVKSRAITSVLL